MDSRTVAKQLLDSGMQIEGFRRSEVPIRQMLDRYIPTVTIRRNSDRNDSRFCRLHGSVWLRHGNTAHRWYNRAVLPNLCPGTNH